LLSGDRGAVPSSPAGSPIQEVAGVEFIDKNGGGGPGVRLRKGPLKKR
jgi:hypothetical protein